MLFVWTGCQLGSEFATALGIRVFEAKGHSYPGLIWCFTGFLIWDFEIERAWLEDLSLEV